MQFDLNQGSLADVRERERGGGREITENKKKQEKLLRYREVNKLHPHNKGRNL